VQPQWKTIRRFLKKLNIDLPYNPTIPLLRIYLKECDSGYYKGTCTPTFISELFIIAKVWKWSRCPTTDKWIKKMWYLYTMVLYSATKKNEILSFSGKWMELENIILSKVSQAQTTKKSHVLPHMQIIDLKQMQLYYWTWLMHRRNRERERNLKVVDVLSIEEPI
jgi:hypothetical protein